MAISAHALNPSRQVTQYAHDSWNYQNGLPGGAVYNVYQLPDGYLWLRQASGLLRFDGLRFTPVDPQVPGAPVNEDIRAISRTPDGRLLLRGNSRTLYLKNSEFVDAARPARLRDGTERVVAQTTDGTFWIGADSNFYRLKDGVMEPLALGTGWVSAIHEDRSGNVWIGAGTGLYRFNNERLVLYPTGFNEGVAETFLPTEKVVDGVRLGGAVTAVIEDRHGVIWVGTHAGLCKIVDDALVQDESTAALDNRQISSLLQDQHGNLWAGTDGEGLFRLTNGQWAQLTHADGLSDDGITCLSEDREGSLWIGTRSGLDRLRDTPLASISSREGLAHDNAAVVTEGKDGTIYVYTFGGGLTAMKNGTMTTFTKQDGLGSDYAGTLYVARDGTLWLGMDRGLFTYRNGAFQQEGDHQQLGRSYISSICEDDEGIVLATSQLALYRYKNGAFTPYPLGVPPGPGPENAKYVYAMETDAEGTLWIGMTAGLWKVPRGTAPENAEPSAYRLPVHAFHDDGRGYIWISGPQTRGLTRLRKSDNQLVTVGPEAGVPAGEIGRIITDRHGNLWLGTRVGIVTVAREQIDAYAEGRLKVVNTRAYGVIDGMKTEECAGSDQQPSAWRARDGTLYFGTRRGLVVVDPDRLPRNTRVPPVVVEEFVADEKVYPKAGNLELQPGTSNLEIHYTALSLLAPSRVRFKYQLDGFDAHWVEAGTRRTAYYTQLPPGTYQFRVIACNDDGVWNEIGDSVVFTLRPHFYQTIWFYLACGLGVIVGAHALHRYRIRRLKHREAELIAIVDERTGKLREEIAEHTEARRELQNYREYLEQLVAERTAALQASNLRLQREITERRLSEERYRSFFDEDLAGAFIATPSGMLVTFNPSFGRIFGFVQGAASRANLEELFRNPADAGEMVAELRRLGKLQDREFEMKSVDGRPLSVVANINGSFSSDGDLLEVKGYVVDASERKRLETELRQSQKMEAIGQLAGGIAHDFNNLLTAIIGSSECIIEDAQREPGIAHLASEIREAGQRAASLTRQLLAFSRKQVLQPRVINLNDEVREMETMLRRLIGADIALKLDLASDLSSLRADPSQIQQIILNLSVNARDAMPRGGRLLIRTANICIDEAAKREHQGVPYGHYATLSVVDSGVGMSAEVQAHLFEPFFTTKGVGKGTGLGLSTVYGIVQQSNGHIQFTSKEGQGTSFTIFLPSVDAAPDPTTRRDTAPPVSAGGETILLVEDNELVLGVTRRCLQQYGFSVIEASHAYEAIDRCRARNGRIDLMITDVVMPDMNGRDLADELKKDFPDMKVLFMSGYTGDALGRFGDIANGVLIEKPFTAEILIRRVREILNGS